MFAGVAAQARAQAVGRVQDNGYGVEQVSYFQYGKRGRDDGRGGGYGEQNGGGGGFRRGQVLPQNQRDRAVDDPGRYHLRNAPNGYGWVGDGRNAYLMQRSTGMVLDAVPGAYEGGPRNRTGNGGGARGYQGQGGGGRVQDGGGGGGGRGREQDGGGGGKRNRR